MSFRWSWVGAVLVMLGTAVGYVHGAAAAERSASSNYILRCLGCHGADGSGAPNTGIPAFPGFLDPLYATDAGRTYLVHVPGVSSSGLNTKEISQVLNYIAKRWASHPERLQPFTLEEVQQRQQLQVQDIVALRRYLSDYHGQQGVALAPYPWP